MPKIISEKILTDFAAYLHRQEREKSTIEKYHREAAAFVVWLNGRTLTRELAVAYKDYISQHRTASGVNGAISALNSLFTFLGLHSCKLKAFRIQRQIFRDETRELNQSEYRRLVAAAERRGNRRLMLVMETICATGIRVSELRFITVEATKTGRADVKNKGKTRTVFLPSKLCKLLLKYAKERGINEGYVFVTRSGKPLDRGNIWHDMKALCKIANVSESKVFPHNLRHLFARTYYQLEKDIVRLADILGHSSVNTTRIYTMESGQVHRRMLERMKLVI